MEKKILKVILSGSDNTVYASKKRHPFDEPLFAFVAPPNKGELKCKTDLTYCRESMCEYIRQDLRNVSNYGVVLSKVHLIIHRSVAPKGASVFEKQVLAGQNMVNIIEQHYGWPLTRIYGAGLFNPKESKRDRFYYITASKRWIKSPIMLSLFTLLFRIATIEREFKFTKNINSFDDIFIVLGKLASANNQIELSYFRAHGHYWEAVLDHYQQLFGKHSMARMYSPDNNGYYFTEGINTLCDCSSGDRTLTTAFKKILSKPSQFEKIRERMEQSDPSA